MYMKLDSDNPSYNSVVIVVSRLKYDLIWETSYLPFVFGLRVGV